LKIDLKKLREMHPQLPVDVAEIILLRAALALQRNGHSSGVGLSLQVERLESKGTLSWRTADLSTITQHDTNRITEDGAEALTLAVMHQDRQWRVVRRMQREEFADWLLERDGDSGSETAALEVSGVDKGGIASRLREKLSQVAKSTDVDQKWAGVAGFELPIATIESSTRGRRVTRFKGKSKRARQ
jgi:hypothetical protein